MQLLGKTSVTPNYKDNLYYVKGNDLMAHSKKSGTRKVVAKNVFPMSKVQKHTLYFAKKDGGKLAVYCAKMKRK